MWLNDKEEEEINYDWSERNTNMGAKKENYSVSVEHFINPFRVRIKRIFLTLIGW